MYIKSLDVTLPSLMEMSRSEYDSLKASGMMWVYYPHATGNYEKDCKVEVPTGGRVNKDDFSKYEKIDDESLEKSGEIDIVKRPNHYQLLPEYEVKHVIKALLDKVDASDFEMTSYQAGWLQQSLQYLLRFYAKNGLEDLEKGYETLGFVIEDMKKKV